MLGLAVRAVGAYFLVGAVLYAQLAIRTQVILFFVLMAVLTCLAAYGLIGARGIAAQLRLGPKHFFGASFDNATFTVVTVRFAAVYMLYRNWWTLITHVILWPLTFMNYWTFAESVNHEMYLTFGLVSTENVVTSVAAIIIFNKAENIAAAFHVRYGDAAEQL